MFTLPTPTRMLFFTGKGGVGKTSAACATAVGLADAGKRVLLVSTDPASNLDEVLGVALSGVPAEVPGVPGLRALNIDPEAAARDYRERMVGPYRGVLPASAVASMEEQFSGSCTLEIAAFDEFAKLLAGGGAAAEAEHVVFDTAPTGHTLRLLSLPSAWSEFLGANTTGTSCLGPLAGLQAQQRLYADTVAALGDPAVTTLALVARPDAASLREAARTSAELAELGIRNQRLILNGVFRAAAADDPFAEAMERRARAAMAAIPPSLAGLPRSEIPLAPHGVVGVAALRRFGDLAAAGETPAGAEPPTFPPLGKLVEEIAARGHGVVLAMGKGGVGKTTVAAAVAVALADRGFPVRLTTTDPAAHVAEALHGSVAGLSVGRIDPRAVTAAYTAEVLATAGAGLDAGGRAMLEEDLRSPCTEEIAVFRAFAEEVAQGAGGFVVLDTAPTGHTVLLLDSALAYHREVARQATAMPETVQQLLPRLRDPEFTHALLVALPEATPVHEAAQLQADLRRAGIEPFAWVANQCLAPLPVRDPTLVARRRHEGRYLNEIQQQHATRTAMVAWQCEDPVGPDRLRALLG